MKLLVLCYVRISILVSDISGAGFGSKNKYMFGKVTVQLKLVEGDSAGTVTAFYVSDYEYYLLCMFIWRQLLLIIYKDVLPLVL